MKKKSTFLVIIGILLITASIMYRKYRRAQLREEQQKVQREQARKIYEFQKKKDSIRKKQVQDSINKIRLQKFNKKYDEIAEKRKKLQETMKKLNASKKN